MPGEERPLTDRFVLVAGDVHANVEWMAVLLRLAREHGCRHLLQLGDMGVWPNWSTGEEHLALTSQRAIDLGIEVSFIDGNHEDHQALAQFEPGPDGWVEILPAVRWARRGHRWTWSDRTFVAMGGAHSVDRPSRVENVTWFQAEEITEADLRRVGDEPADVFVTHEAPLGAPLTPYRLHKPNMEARYRQGRERVLAAARAVRPRVLFHGHWHMRKRYGLADVPGMTVEALASDIQGDGSAWGVLDLSTLDFNDGTELSGR